MTLRIFMVFIWCCLIGAAALAGEEHRTQIKIAVEGDDAEHRVFRFDSQDSDIDLRDIAVGESRVITDSDGNEVSVLRTEDGFEFDVEGEKIEVSGIHEEHDFAILHDGHDVEDIMIKKHKQVRVLKNHDAAGVTVISNDEIDDETRAKLQKVLEDAGKDGDIVFIDGTELDGGEQAQGVRMYRMIKKESDATN